MTAQRASSPGDLQHGVSLIELMVALVLGVFLILGAVSVYNQSRRTYGASESVARLQEVGRLAMNVLETDIRMASYWGLNNTSVVIANRAGPTQGTVFSTSQEAIIDSCGGDDSNWAIDIDEYIGGSNDSYGLDATACPATNVASTTSDVLVIRRASDMPVSTMVADRLYIQTSRTQGTLFIANSSCLDATNTSCIPSIFAPPLSQTRLLEAKAYYVANQSTLRADVPSLRRKTFSSVTASNSVTDEELVSGIEDVQVRFGVDTDLDLEADTYLNPGEVSPADMVVSATIWLRVRAEDRDFGHVDDNSYQYYPGMTAFTPGDNYRRIVLSKTIQLRNTRI